MRKDQTTEKTTEDKWKQRSGTGERRGGHEFAVTLSFYDHLFLEEYCF